MNPEEYVEKTYFFWALGEMSREAVLFLRKNIKKGIFTKKCFIFRGDMCYNIHSDYSNVILKVKNIILYFLGGIYRHGKQMGLFVQ